MKKYLLPFALILLLVTQTKAQTSVYHPFPDSNAVWNENDGYLDGGDNYEWYFQQFLKGDTSLNGLTYHKIYYSGIYGYLNSNYELVITESDTNKYIGAIRENSNRQIFFYDNDSIEENLLYDFNLSLGDTLPLSYLHTDPNVVIWVSMIDSIYDGTNYRKKYILNYNFAAAPSTLIEGIGSTYGLIYSIDPPFENDGNLCSFIYNDTIRYMDNMPHACEYITPGIEEKKNMFEIALSPNPATNQLTIHTTSFHNEAVMVSVVDMLGQNASPKESGVLRTPPTPLHLERGDAIIDVSGLAAGMYFLQLKWESGNVVKKFVKE